MRTPFDSQGQLRSLYIISALLSLMVSGWITMHQVIVNSDAICYLLSASEIGDGGISAAMKLCGQASWPFYSILIYAFSQSAFISVTTAAYFMNACFTMLSVLSFITIVKMLGGTRRVLWLAAFVILCSHQFNSVRQYIIRDHGFWAFYLLSLCFMLRYMRAFSLQNALGFSISMGIAALFRIEGVVFMALLPFVVFFNNNDFRTRVMAYIKLNIVTACAALTILFWMMLNPSESVEKLGRLPELVRQITGGAALVYQSFQTAKFGLIQHVLPSEATRDANLVWFVVTIILYLSNVVNNLSWIITALLIYACVGGVVAKFSGNAKRVLLAYLLINLLISAMFFAEHLFLSKRYLVAMSLTFLVVIPFTLDHLLQNRSNNKRRYVAYLAMFALFISSFMVMINSDKNRTFVREGGSWIAANIPVDARLYSNDVQLAYYSGHYGKNIFRAMHINHNIDSLLAKKIQKFDYVAVRTGKPEADRIVKHMKSIQADAIVKIENEEGNQIKVFKMPKQAS